MMRRRPAAPGRPGARPAAGGAGRPAQPRVPGAGFRSLTLAAAITTYLLIVAGGVVRVTGSGLGCGVTGQDWPLCHGRLVPPADVATVIEFSHRSLAFIATVLIVATALVALRRYRSHRRIVVPATLVVLQLIVQILLGAVTVEWKLPGGIVLVHLANALLLLAVLVWVCVAAFTASRPPAAPPVDAERGARLARLGLIGAVTTFAIVLSGGLVVADGAGYACSGWPLCGGGLQLRGTELAVINLLHRGVVGAGSVVLVIVAVRLASALRPVGAVRAAAVAVVGLLAAQAALGAVLVDIDLPTLVRGLHEAFAGAVWASAVLLAVLVWPDVLARLPVAATGRSRPAGLPREAALPAREAVS